MRLRIIVFVVSSALSSHFTAYPQVTVFPYVEYFDGVVPPSLPIGWTCSQKSAGTYDFIVTTGTQGSTTKSGAQAVVTTGDKDSKYLVSPPFDFSDKIVNQLQFWDRRSSSSFGADVVVECSLDTINFTLLGGPYHWTGSSSYILHSVSLPDSVSGKSKVWFRWRITGVSSGSVASTYRIDDVSLSVKTGFDIGISKVTAATVNATRKDSITFLFGVKNYGSFISSNFSIRFFCDDNFNGLYEPVEQFFVVNVISLNPGDSVTCIVSHAPLKAGEHPFAAIVEYSSDENHSNDTARVLFRIGNVKGDVLVNEIMYAPAGDEPEWVELYNTSPDTINLKNWRISDSNISTKTIVTQTDVLFPPNSYLVIAKDNIFTTYHPGVVPVLTNFSALNNSTPDAVVIYDARLTTIDSVMYAPSWGGQNGKSLERIDAEMPGISMTNWKTSQDSIGSTPGRKNSVARLDYDLMISNLMQTHSLTAGKIVPGINVGICNIGRRTVDSVLVSFYSDNNRNDIPESSERIHTITIARFLAAGDSILVSESLPQLPSGGTNIIVIADWWRDENIRNNRESMFVKICFEPRSLIINEIMYDPLPDQNEWFELFNRSSQPIDLSRWTFNDKPTVSSLNSFEICSQPFVVKSGDYAIVAADSSIFRLVQNTIHADSIAQCVILNRSGGFGFNNDGDAIALKDLAGQTIDSVSYSPSWHHPDVVGTRGRSLERINTNIDSNDPRNWSTCSNILGGTPGKTNSINATSIKSSSIISVAPNPFSPDGDGFEDYCIIRYNLPMMTSTLNLKIYDIKGRLVRALANGEFAGAQGEIVWDGIDDDKQRVRIGVYVVFLEATDQSSGKVVTSKTAAVVAAKL
jgi:hypothetical protein